MRPEQLREKPEVATTRRRPPTTASARPPGPTRRSPSRPSGASREIEVDLDDVFPHLDRHVLFKLHWGGRGKKGEEWRRIVEGHDGEEGFAPRSSGCGASRTTSTREPGSATSPPPRTATSSSSSTRGSRPGDRAARLPAPAQARPDLPHRLLPAADDSGERDVVALQGVTVGPEVTELIEKLEARRRVRRAAVHPRPRRPGRGGARRVAALGGAARARHRSRPGTALLLGLSGLPRPVRAREGLAAARPG